MSICHKAPNTLTIAVFITVKLAKKLTNYNAK